MCFMTGLSFRFFLQVNINENWNITYHNVWFLMKMKKNCFICLVGLKSHQHCKGYISDTNRHWSRTTNGLQASWITSILYMKDPKSLVKYEPTAVRGNFKRFNPNHTAIVQFELTVVRGKWLKKTTVTTQPGMPHRKKCTRKLSIIKYRLYMC